MAWNLGAGLAGRGALVTGAGSGIGRSTAQLLATAGARVCAIDQDGAAVRDCVESLAGEGHHHIALDLRAVDELETMVDEVCERLGEVYVLAHVAAALRRQPLDEVTEEDWDLQQDVNLKSAFFLNRAVGRRMIAQGGGGRIVNFTSGEWLTGPVGDSHAHVAGKGGVVSMTRGFARSYGPHGILVNVVSPGPIDVPLQHGNHAPERVPPAAAASPLGRRGRAEDVAAAVLFLASDHASFISGATLNVSGAAVMY